MTTDPILSDLTTAMSDLTDVELVGVQSFARELRWSPRVIAVFEVVAQLAALERAGRTAFRRAAEQDLGSEHLGYWTGDLPGDDREAVHIDPDEPEQP